MGKLPDIEYGGRVERSSDTAAAPYEAARGASKVLAEGLTLWSQELVKTQMQRAGTKFAEQMNADEETLNAPFISAGELRDILGDSIPPHVRKLLEVKNEKGELVDNEAIPMFTVAGALHDHYARRATDAAASDIPMSGWQSEFKDRAREIAVARKARVNEKQMKAALTYMKQTQQNDIAAKRNTARTPQEFADVRADILRSNALDPAEKAKELKVANEAEQLRPVLDASTANDPEAMKAQITRLEAGGEDVSHIDPQHRNAYVKSLRAQIEARERELKEDADKHLKVEARARWTGIQAKQDELRRSGRRLTSAEYSQLLPKPGTVLPDDWDQMNRSLAALAKPPPAESNPAVYWNVTQSMMQDPEGFKQGKVTIPGPDGKPRQVSLYELRPHLEDTHFYKFVDLMRSSTSDQPYVYRGAITDQEAINAALVNKGQYDLKTTDADEQREIGHLTAVVNNTLAVRAQAKGSALDAQERDLAINEVLDREVKVKKNGLLYRLIPFTDAQERKVATLGVRPEVAVALYEGTAQGGRRMTPDEVVAAATDYAKFEPGILETWGRYGAGKPLAPDVAVHIYYLIDRDKALIDESLKGQLTGDEAKDARLRAAQAVRGYLQKGVR